MSSIETFPERVARIAKEHNISEREAVRVALSMERFEKRIELQRAALAEGATK